MAGVDVRAGDDRFSPAGGVRILRMSGRPLLYSEQGQQLLELNPTADRIWRGLETHGRAGAVDAVRELGASDEAAAGLVDDTLVQWIGGGYLAPPELARLLAGVGRADRVLRLDELALEIRASGLDCEALEPVFGHLYARDARPRRRLSLVAYGGQVLIYLERTLIHVARPEGWVAELKAVLTDLYVDAVENAFLAHAALLSKRDCTLLLAGAPGAGKTTLALALAAAGWRYGADDIVRITPDALAGGAPFAAAVKEGALPLLAAMWPGLERASVWLRADGQRTRYLLPPNHDAGPPRAPDLVVVLDRRPGVSAALRRIEAIDALGALLEGGYARRWRMTGGALGALAARLEAAVCARLTYCDLPSALQALEELADVPAHAA